MDERRRSRSRMRHTPSPPRNGRASPRTPSTTEAELMLRKQPMEIADYQYKWRSVWRTLSVADRFERFGSKWLPIAIPLRRRESIREYETRFEAWLALRGVTLNALRACNNPLQERHKWISFANFNAQQYANEKRTPTWRSPDDVGVVRSWPARKLQQFTEPDHQPPSEERGPEVDGDRSPPDASADSYRRAHVETSASDDGTKSQHLAPRRSMTFPSQCRRQQSESSSPHVTELTTVVQDCTDCGCAQCVREAFTAIGQRLAGMQGPAQSTTQAVTVAPVIDLTEEDPPTTGPSAQPTRSTPQRLHQVDVSRLLAARQELNVIKRPHSPLALIGVDPIQVQLVREYEQLNTQVTTAGTTSVQQSLLDNRTAALAMLIVYMWRAAPGDLIQRVQAPEATDAPEIVAKAHGRWATHSSRLHVAIERSTALGEAIDRLVGETPLSTSDDERLCHLTRLGEELAAVQEAIADLRRDQRRELLTMIHVDAQLRDLIQTLLARA